MAGSIYPTIQELENTYIDSKMETLFYNAVQIHVAIKIANEIGKRTHETCWPSHMIQPQSRNLACYRMFASEFSTILAQKAIGSAYIVTPPLLVTDNSNLLTPSETSIWTCHEAFALEKNSRVKRLIWVNSKMEKKRDRWSR